MGLFDRIKSLFRGKPATPRSATPGDLARDFGDAVDPGLLGQRPTSASPSPAPADGSGAEDSKPRGAQPIQVPAHWIGSGQTPAAPSTAIQPVSQPSWPLKAATPAAAPRTESLDYDLGLFAPISSDDLRKGADQLKNNWNNLWLFGRSNRIPPTADPRTNLIDRAMVSQGLLTPEELAEIHAVGLEYDAVRPDVQIELAKAQLAVTASEQERAERKARKKAEAAERKRKYAEAVALRRATDIVFLGRGVSSRLHDRASDAAKLSAIGVPILATPADVATALGLTISRLRWLAFHSEAATVTHYVRFNVPKKSGGVRQLAAPHETLADAQQWILANILSRVGTHDAAHGFVPTRSTVTNAQPHVGKPIVVNCDLKDFFPTITFPRVRGIFHQLGYSPAVATILALLCTECPRQEVTYAGRPFHVATGPRSLPQGACTSPALSNLAARRLDARLAGICRKLNFTYTRYADDLTFSADFSANDKIGYLLARVRHITQDECFAVNEKKTRVQRPHVAQTVTGIVVNTRPGVPRDVVRRLRAILHRAKTEGLAAQNRENLPHFEAWLDGMIAYVQMVNPKQAGPLREALAALPR